MIVSPAKRAELIKIPANTIWGKCADLQATDSFGVCKQIYYAMRNFNEIICH